jgi:hypothetical protein
VSGTVKGVVNSRLVSREVSSPARSIGSYLLSREVATQTRYMESGNWQLFSTREAATQARN